MIDKDEVAILTNNITNSIKDILENKKISYMSDTPEFVEGLLVGLEIAGIYGNDIQKVYSDFVSRNNSE
jgi:hypothetical protein